MIFSVTDISPYTSLIGFCIGLPTAAATYYQAWKSRQEAAQARAALRYSKNCLEFVMEDGRSVNLVMMQTLYTLPKVSEIVLLPGSGIGGHGITMGAFRVGRIEHIYSPMEGKRVDPAHARLVKTVAYVTGLDEPTREPIAYEVVGAAGG